MPVSTISLNDFLVQKNSGDIVTGDDWNKLIALFHATNINANALLKLMKAVDTNTANIAHVTQGAVPDGSISYSKLSKMGGTTNTYVLSTDLKPVAGVTYYTLEDTKYVPHPGLEVFDEGVKYYTLETVVTEPAIADSDVIGNHVIEVFNCVPSFLATLLDSSVDVYSDKAITGTIGIEEKTISIVLPKEHKHLLVINKWSVLMLNADALKPDIVLTSVNQVYENDLYYPTFRIATAIDANKKTCTYDAIAGIRQASWDGGRWREYRTAFIKQAYYDVETNTIHCTLKCSASDVDYSFGDLIIGL